MPLQVIFFVAVFSVQSAYSASLKLTTSVSASADKVGGFDRPGLLFKFELPAELQNSRIDLAYLRFKVQPDSSQKSLGLLVRPMLLPWLSGQRFSSLPDSSASPFHINFGRVSLKSGSAEIEVTQLLKAWQSAELPNLGVLVYAAAEKANTLQLKNLPTGGVAELEIFYTPSDADTVSLNIGK